MIFAISLKNLLAASTEGPQLTPVASYEGQIVASNLLNGNHTKPDYKGVPSVIFTIPPMASVGLLEENAQRQGLRFKTNHMDTSGWYSSKRIGERYSAFKVLIEENTGKILGAHILGPHAEEVINIFAVAIRMGISANQLKQTMFAYPTNSSDITYML
ncbi:MAG: NAD(P)/FAD-dependent oxidoreductase [Nitrosopumilus sp.]|nr:NAD(P)/FAD-dependent oxidoreductase [Nitrosopumilus sp.]